MISSRQKVTLSRDDYREFNEKVMQLQEANYEFVHVVTHNKEDDTFTIETNNTERYRFGSNGEFLISGTNAGTTNEVFTSQIQLFYRFHQIDKAAFT